MENIDNSANGAAFMVDTIEFFVPLTGMVNAEEEIAKMEAEIAHLTKFLPSVPTHTRHGWQSPQW